MSISQIKALMNPRSIAIVGASNGVNKMGSYHALSIMNDGFRGAFYPVHPKDDTVLGCKAYAKISDLPEVPDLAMLIVPAPHIPGLMEEFGKLGTKSAIIISAGFRETGEAGAKLEDQVIEISEKYGMRFVGPNCIGTINSEISLNTTVHPLPEKAGHLGVISQSGTYVAQALTYLENRGIRFSKAVSVGNEASISLTDVLEYLGEDDQTKAISLYVEGIKDIPRFIEVARKVTRKKPVVAQYTGGSKAGARSCLGHTGAMAGPDPIYAGIFKQAGIIRVHTIEDLYWWGWTLSTQPPLKGNKVGIVTNSGGPGSAIANALEEGGLEIPLFSSGLQKKIKEYLQGHAPSGNPVDLTFILDMQDFTKRIPELIIKSGEADAIVMHGVMQTGFMKTKYPHLKEVSGGLLLEDLVTLMESDPKSTLTLPDIDVPLIVSSFMGKEDNCIRTYLENDVPVFNSPEKAAGGIVALFQHKKVLEREPYEEFSLPEPNHEVSQIIASAHQSNRKSFDEFTAKKILKHYGIPISNERRVESEEGALSASEKIGYPVALKVCDSEILHKTEKGLVFLNLDNPEKVKDAFRKIKASAGENAGILVTEMVMGEREFVSGMVRDDACGPCVVFGMGGVFTEVFNDKTFRVAPLSLSDAREMVLEIKSAKLLKEFRGMPSVDISALSDLIFKLGILSCLHPEISEIDLNPIIIRGNTPVVVDALMVV